MQIPGRLCFHREASLFFPGGDCQGRLSVGLDPGRLLRLGSGRIRGEAT